jgi:mersacidin/lichenicidin family type 2 lantibiotic
MQERRFQRRDTMKLDVVRAWKDPSYRAGLSAGEFALAPPNPAGLVELSDEQLKEASGLAGFPQTTFITCTEYTYARFRCCKP